MCRIAGIVSYQLQPAIVTEKVKAMCSALKHGGPDDEGFFLDDERKFAFGHRRLSIIDLSPNGHQPMADVQQRAFITFNGEIYNYRELKKDLVKLGARFHSETDTEVIIQAYLHWGIGAFAMLRGMFAFALHDKQKAVTYLVRDVAGIKPLYYYIENGQLSFASEVKALKASGIANEPDGQWQIRFLAFGHIPEPYTTLKNVFSLPKGHFLQWDDNDKNCTIAPFINPPDESYILDENEAKMQINRVLQASVNRQLISDAPIGVFLSGGIDSSLITLLANKNKKTQLKTVSIFFDEKAYDESAYQKVVFNRIEGDKFTHLVKQQDFEESFPRIMNAMDMPTNDGINTWFISKYAKQDGLKAVLSGLGADELYGGYPSFNRIKYTGYLKKVPSALFFIATAFAPDRLKKIEYLYHNHPLADYLLLRGLFAPADIAKILDADLTQVNKILFGDNINYSPAHYDKEYAAWLETNLYMQNQLLRDTDVMSMSHGLEVRVPFLDEDFQALTSRISPEIRFGNNSKKLLIDSFKDILPAEISNRPKMGFTFPLQQWMHQYPAINDYSLYKGKAQQLVLKKFKSDKLHWSKIFALYQLQIHG
jgi:asparagine synthase (glutamine-hydrolysing)